jgi:hypothetical protein
MKTWTVEDEWDDWYDVWYRCCLISANSSEESIVVVANESHVSPIPRIPRQIGSWRLRTLYSAHSRLTHTHPNFQPAGSRKQEEVILQPSFPARSFPLEAQTLHISLLVTEYIYARGPITDLYSFARSTNLLFVMHPLIRSLSITFFSHVLFPVAVQVTFL